MNIRWKPLLAFTLGLTLAGCQSGAATPGAQTTPAATNTIVAAATQAPTQNAQTPVPTATPAAPTEDLRPTATTAASPESPTQPAGQTPTAAPTQAPAQPTGTAPAGGATLPANAPWVLGPEGIIAATDGQPTLPLVSEHGPRSEHSIAVAPNGSAVAYVNVASLPATSHLVIVNTATGEKREIPSPSESTSFISPQFSPDGRQLAVTLQNQQGWQLQILDVQTGNARSVATGAGNNPLAPVDWNSAGLLAQELIFYSDAPPQSLVLVNTESGATQTIIGDQFLGAYPADDASKVAVTNGQLSPGLPAQQMLSIFDPAAGTTQTIEETQQGFFPFINWSPDGSKLVYGFRPDQGLGSPQQPLSFIRVVNADGSQVQTLDVAAAGISGEIKDVDWLDNQTLGVTIVGSDGIARLYDLPLSSFATGGLQERVAFETNIPNTSWAIVYAPR